MKISKVLTIFPILYLCLAVQPAMAQREAWEDLVKKTSALGSEISAVIKDTAELHRKIESIAPQMLDWDAEIDSINKQIKSISNSIDSDNFALLKNEIDSFAEVKKNNEKEVLFSVSHLKKYFQVGKNATLKAVDDVSFEIYKGETLGMVGESGCGKTTCGRTCIGLYSRTDGEVLFKGKDPQKLTGKEKQNYKKSVQMVFQEIGRAHV